MHASFRLTVFLVAFATLGIVNYLATEFYLYWKYMWFDIPMHVLGGVCVALGIFILPVFRIRIPQRYMRLLPVLGVVSIVGILWELFEMGLGLPAFEEQYAVDTCIDLVMDLIGGCIGYGVIKYSERY